jgi:N-acetylglucosaminyl-diphospho-decaprenol L-rhamnosyltransferase
LTIQPDFSVLIVNYNGGAYVQGALDSLKAQTHRSFEVILLDNASNDGSADALDTSGLPAFTLLREAENHGFARGNNLAAAVANGKWLALLNPDAAARPDWLAQIASGIQRYPDVYSFACTQLRMHDEAMLDGAGDNYLVCGIPWRGGYGRHASELPAEGECFSACGASAVYCRETYTSLGGFDERLFCFCEDVDLGFRLRLAGGDCIFLPRAIVAHAGGGLSNKVSGFSVCYGTRNRLWVYLKCMPLPILLLTLPGHIALTIAILLRGLMTGRSGPAWTGLSEALSDLGPVWEKRRQIQAQRTVNTRALLSIMVWNPVKMLRRQTYVVRRRANTDLSAAGIGL